MFSAIKAYCSCDCVSYLSPRIILRCLQISNGQYTSIVHTISCVQRIIIHIISYRNFRCYIHYNQLSNFLQENCKIKLNFYIGCKLAISLTLSIVKPVPAAISSNKISPHQSSVLLFQFSHHNAHSLDTSVLPLPDHIIPS